METVYYDLRAALKFITDVLIPNRHLYILNVDGRAAPGHERLQTVQIVDQEHVRQDGELGLSLYLAFAYPEWAEHHARFLASPLRKTFFVVPFDDVFSYAACFGTDIDAAMRMTFQVITTVYLNGDAVDLECTLYDEGHWED